MSDGSEVEEIALFFNIPPTIIVGSKFIIELIYDIDNIYQAFKCFKINSIYLSANIDENLFKTIEQIDFNEDFKETKDDCSSIKSDDFIDNNEF